LDVQDLFLFNSDSYSSLKAYKNSNLAVLRGGAAYCYRCVTEAWSVWLGLAPLDVDDLFLFKENSYSSLQAYKNSKLANLLFTYELARQITSSGVIVIAVDPGTYSKKGNKT